MSLLMIVVGWILIGYGSGKIMEIAIDAVKEVKKK